MSLLLELLVATSIAAAPRQLPPPKPPESPMAFILEPRYRLPQYTVERREPFPTGKGKTKDYFLGRVYARTRYAR